MSAGNIRNSTQAVGSSTSSFSINAVSGQAQGDQLVLWLLYNSAFGTASVSGGGSWSSTGLTAVGTATLQGFYRTAGGSEPASYTLSGSGTGNCLAILCAFLNSNALDNLGSSNNGTGTTATDNGVTVSGSNETLCAAFAKTSTGSITPQASMVSAQGTIGTGSITLNVATEGLTSSGASGNRTATWTGSASWGGQLVSIPATPSTPFMRVLKVFAPQPPLSYFD